LRHLGKTPNRANGEAIFLADCPERDRNVNIGSAKVACDEFIRNSDIIVNTVTPVIKLQCNEFCPSERTVLPKYVFCCLPLKK